MPRRSITTTFACLCLSLACGSGTGPSAPTRKAQNGGPAAVWCDSLNQSLARLDSKGFRCLELPNFLLTGFFGPKSNPEQSDFANACFAGDEAAGERLRISVRPAGDLAFRFSTKQKASAAGGVNLGFLGPWAPKVEASGSSERSYSIEVSLEDAEMRVLSSVAEIIGQKYEDSAEDSPLRHALDGCIQSLCGQKSESVVYTAKVLAAVPVITVKTTERSANGLHVSNPIAGFEVDHERSTSSSLVIRSKEKLNVAALLEDAGPAFMRARTCERVQAQRKRHEVLTGLREIALRTLSGRALDEVPKLAGPLRNDAEHTPGAFSQNEQRSILGSLETIEGAARQLALPKPNNSLCAVRSMAESILTGPADDNRVHGVLVDVIQPIRERLTELANQTSLPCADPLWFLDRDRDGYGDKKSSQRAPSQPPGHVANALDCYDHNPEAHPGQAHYFSQHRGDGSFDYDCDNRSNVREEVASNGCRESTVLGYPTKCWADPGWVGSVPGCGQKGRWLSECEVSVLTCGPIKESRGVQECR
jgi:hypothetical protein